MAKQYAIQVAHVYLRNGTERTLSAYAHKEVTEWLTQWTCRANFKAVLAPTQGEGLRKLQAMLQEKLVPDFMAREGVKPEHFEFDTTMQEVEDGWFWMPSGLVYLTRHPVVGEIRW